MLPSAEHIEALSDDRAAILVARRTARPEAWAGLGRSDDALWGSCAGSDGYRVMVALEGLLTRCTCESPRSPCRHALALLLLASQHIELFPELEAPEEVRSWLKRRAAQRRGRGSPGDVKGRKKRSEAREERVRSGLAALRTWLSDRARVGLADLENQPESFWRESAKRLEDHQIRGVPERVVRLGEAVGTTPEWPAGVLAELGRLAVLVEAAERQDTLPAPLQAELRTQLGFAQKEAEVLEHGARCSDDWWVLGQSVEQLVLSNGLRAERTWLLGQRSGKSALYLRYQHSSDAGRARPGPALPPPGQRWRGTVAWYAGASEQRAALLSTDGETDPIAPPLPGLSIPEALDAAAQQWAANPFLDRVLLLLGPIVPTLHEGRCWARGEDGEALPLRGGPCWWLLAISGGHPITLAAEWDGQELRPIGALADGAWHLPEL